MFRGPRSEAKRFLRGQFRIMKKYGSAPAQSLEEYENYQEILERAEQAVVTLRQRVSKPQADSTAPRARAGAKG
jgi:hypothetical protein